MEVEVICQAEAEVGESPLWDEERQCLWWVDLLKGELHTWNLGAEDRVCASIGKSLGFIVPLGTGEFVAGTADSVGTLSPSTGVYFPKVALERDRSGYRANDGKCDPKGRLWLGTMSDRHWQDGRWYRVAGDWQLVKWHRDFDLPNGLCWSADGSRIYLADSARGVIEIWSYDLEAGLPGNLLNTIEIPPAQGRPDGMTVDEEDCIWVALWGGGAIRRYRPCGVLDRQLELPVTLVASCEFGGRDHELLFITTARYKLSDEQLSVEPLAGSIFVCQPGPTGLPAHKFALDVTSA